MDRDILHPNRANIKKEELRDKLASLYKAQKEQVSVFGLRTQFGGGKTTGFALVYDSPEAMKKFEPNYRLVRVGLATKAERASRQQRWSPALLCCDAADAMDYRQAAQEPTEDPPRHGKGQGTQAQEGEIDDSLFLWRHLFHRVSAGDGKGSCCCALHWTNAAASGGNNRDDLAHWDTHEGGVTVGLRDFFAAHSIQYRGVWVVHSVLCAYMRYSMSCEMHRALGISGTPAI